MEEKMENKNEVRFSDLIDAARREDWDFVDAGINESHLAREQVQWVINEGISDEDQNVRDLATTLLDRSDEIIDQSGIEKLLQIMASDPYHIVRYRIAIALYKRNNLEPAVEQMMNEALADPDVGDLAKSFLK